MTAARGADGWAEPFFAAHEAELVAFRRHLHSYPELAYEEHETTALIAQRLELAGLKPTILPGGSGLVCDIDGQGEGEGPTIALRGDLDALAMDDEKDVPYRSHHPGVAHACGHDVHTTLVLGAGLALCDLLRDRPGRVRLIFEPAEETLPGGAIEVIDAGALDGVDAIFGFHCDPKLEAGRVAVRAGALTSACDMFTLDLRGPGGHTARPHMTVDLLNATGLVLTQVPSLVRERAASDGEALVVFGAVASGDAANVIPSHATIGGTFRTPERAVWDRAETLLRDAIGEVLTDTGAEWALHHRRGIPPVMNDGAETERLARVARTVIGDGQVSEAERSLGGDSFAWYLLQVPGTYARLGVHDPERDGPTLDLHSSHFDVDEAAIAVGVRVLVETALDALRT